MFDISALKEMKLSELQEIAKTAKTIKFNGVKKETLISQILEHQAANTAAVPAKNEQNAIEEENYSKIHCIASLITNDDEQGITTSYALTALKFADFWHHNKFDLVFCLGDRFEMSAAVQAGIPFNMKFAHLHGGETTLGAIDNIYRHQITLASILHFTAGELFSDRVIELIGNNKNVYTVGSLSLNEIEKFQPINKTEFFEKFKPACGKSALRLAAKKMQMTTGISRSLTSPPFIL